MKEFLVIELTGDWQDRKKATEAIQATLRATGGVMFENAIITVRAFQNVVNEVYHSSKEKADFQRYIRENIATNIGQQALRDKFIEFSENRGLFETTVKGELLILNLPEVEDDE